MTDVTLARFLAAMASEWVVDRYSVDDDGRLRVHYVCRGDPGLEWAHNPFNELVTTPKIGTVGMLGFIAREEYRRFASAAPGGDA